MWPECLFPLRMLSDITAINIDRAPKPNHESPEVYRYSANEPSPQMQPGPAITSKQRPRLEDSRHKHDMLVELQGTTNHLVKLMATSKTHVPVFLATFLSQLFVLLISALSLSPRRRQISPELVADDHPLGMQPLVAQVSTTSSLTRSKFTSA